MILLQSQTELLVKPLSEKETELATITKFCLFKIKLYEYGTSTIATTQGNHGSVNPFNGRCDQESITCVPQDNSNDFKRDSRRHHVSSCISRTCVGSTNMSHSGIPTQAKEISARLCYEMDIKLFTNLLFLSPAHHHHSPCHKPMTLTQVIYLAAKNTGTGSLTQV